MLQVLVDTNDHLQRKKGLSASNREGESKKPHRQWPNHMVYTAMGVHFNRQTPMAQWVLVYIPSSRGFELRSLPIWATHWHLDMNEGLTCVFWRKVSHTNARTEKGPYTCGLPRNLRITLAEPRAAILHGGPKNKPESHCSGKFKRRQTQQKTRSLKLHMC